MADMGDILRILLRIVGGVGAGGPRSVLWSSSILCRLVPWHVQTLRMRCVRRVWWSHWKSIRNRNHRNWRCCHDVPTRQT
ncbi:unnamed protein product [Nippostrongylus brasiliensis]|uniref:Secreted protein n=1 Tax=Nippostrongylus brasiliensis TaxID=27835 RepID=A0A0N4XPR5_NIPBR|nr:unnamed protein product [Nippostrongylus brasiliensis]